jgi:rare lipoprotein A
MRNAAIIRRVTMVTAAAASLAACATAERAAPGMSEAEPAAPTARPHARSHPRPYARTNPSGQKIGKPYQVNGVWYVPREQPDYDEVGVASWYGEAFHNKTTAIGEPFDMYAVTAAHTTLPLPSIVEVTNLENGRRLRVRVNDRGPFVGNRIIDLSREGARRLGYVDRGLARVRVRYVGPAPLLGPSAGVRVASASERRRPATTRPAADPGAPAPMARASLSFRDQASFTGAKAPASVSRMEVLPTLSSARRQADQPDAAAYRIQAGSFRDEGRARRAASRLSKVAPSVVEPIERDGVTLWRVTVQGPPDQLQAYNLRKQVADAGFADARVVGPF